MTSLQSSQVTHSKRHRWASPINPFSTVGLQTDNFRLFLRTDKWRKDTLLFIAVMKTSVSTRWRKIVLLVASILLSWGAKQDYVRCTIKSYFPQKRSQTDAIMPVYNIRAIAIRSDNASYMLRSKTIRNNNYSILDSKKHYAATQNCNIALSLCNIGTT